MLYVIIFAILIVLALFFWFCSKNENKNNEPVKLRSGCKGEDCSCKKGNPCLSKLPLLQKEIHENKDETYFCPHCDEKSFTLPGGNPYGFAQEYKCGCGHWGWLHY